MKTGTLMTDINKNEYMYALIKGGSMAQEDSDKFIQEYLYVEEMPLLPIEDLPQKKNIKDDECPRGVTVISLFGDEEV